MPDVTYEPVECARISRVLVALGAGLAADDCPVSREEMYPYHAARYGGT
jgi:hypothetical protein